MTRNKHLKSESREVRLKRKKMDVNDVFIDETTGQKKNKKRRQSTRLEALLVIPDAPIKVKDETPKKKTSKPSEISDPPSRPDESVLQGEEDLSPEEKRVLERKMKKILKKEQKKRLRQEGETLPKTEAGPTAAQQALDYLTCWAENRPEWKFQKIRQTWLLQHMFDSEKISDEKFSVLLLYLEGLQGGAKDTTVQKALILVQRSGEEPDDTGIQQRAQRAREVIQLLS